MSLTLALMIATMGLGQPADAGSTGAPPAAEAPANAEQPSLDLLRKRLSGSFASTEQSNADPENYFDIRLHMTPIWTGRNDGPWLYVEQAVAKMPDRPYRQRVYRLSEPSPGVYRSDVYTLADPKAAVGAWADTSKLAGIKPDSLTLREGCALELTWKDGAFVGATKGTGCASDLRGAKYATSEATILGDRLITWDRGYDAKGEQVWGATKGGYIFRRVADAEPAKAPPPPPPAPKPAATKPPA